LTGDVLDKFDLETGVGLANIRQTFIGGSGGGSGSAAARKSFQDQLKFGLEGIGLSREQLALTRQGFGLDREQLGLSRGQLGLSREAAGFNRRDASEAAINNALQRGIFKSGIRVRNERRAGERADLVDEGLDIQGKGLDIQGKRIGLQEGGAGIAGRRLDLSEKELRARIDSALAGLREQAAANKSIQIAQQRQSELDFEQQRRNTRDQAILEAGGVDPTQTDILKMIRGVS
jgi:hypothetical protein